MTLYRCISPDPPWPERGGGGRGAQDKYTVQRVRDLAGIILSSPMWTPNPAGCHVWMWTLGRYLVSGEAALLCQRLGARPVKVIPWVKLRGELHDELDNDDLQMSLGQYGRSAHEYLLLGVIGHLRQLETGRSEPDVIIAPVPRDAHGKRIHSRKPQEAYDKIEAISPGPRLEMFARIRRPGWDAWETRCPMQPDNRPKRMPGEPTKCRSCNADIIWTVTTKGKRMPCDVLAVQKGEFYLFRKADRIEAVHASGTDARVFNAIGRGNRTFVSHFSTCPAAGSHRRSK